MSGKPPTDRDERTLGPDEERSHSSSRQSLTSFTRPLLDVGSWPEAADLECIAPDGKLPLGPLCCPSKKITGARSKSALTENAPYKACSAFTRVAACTLALPPIRDTLIEGFSHFVTSMTAPISSGWSVAGGGLHPLESDAFARLTP